VGETHTGVYVCVYLCVCVCVRLCVYVCVCVSVASVCIFLNIRVWMNFNLHCSHIFIYVCTCLTILPRSKSGSLQRPGALLALGPQTGYIHTQTRTPHTYAHTHECKSY